MISRITTFNFNKIQKRIIIASILVSISIGFIFLYKELRVSFRNTQIEKEAFSIASNYLQKDANIKAIVLLDFPNDFFDGPNLLSAFKKNTLLEKMGSYYLGTQAYPCNANKKSGFKIVFQSSKQASDNICHPYENILFLRLRSSTTKSKILIGAEKRSPFKYQIQVSKDIQENKPLEIDLPDTLNLQFCEVDVVSKVHTNGVLNIRILSKGDENFLERVSANSSGEQLQIHNLFSRERISNSGPYKVRFSLSRGIFDKSAMPLFGAVENISIFGCGISYDEEVFIENHNPDPLNPYLRWVAPKANYTITIPYDQAPIWEKYFGIGVNNARNDGDYYCFPDDTAIIFKDQELVAEAYVGMLYWNRKISVSRDKIVVEFSRTSNDSIATRGEIDQISIERFNSYKKDLLPYSINVKHHFYPNRHYSRVDLLFKSELEIPTNMRWAFQDASVFDFNIGSDRGAESISTQGNLKNTFFYSKNNNIVPIVYRFMEPFRRNMAVAEYSCSNYRMFNFLSIDNTLKTALPPRFEIHTGEVFQKDQGEPNRNHGLSFDIPISAYGTAKATYYKLFLSGWSTTQELVQQAKDTIQIIQETECPKD